MPQSTDQDNSEEENRPDKDYLTRTPFDANPSRNVRDEEIAKCVSPVDEQTPSHRAKGQPVIAIKETDTHRDTETIEGY